MRLCGTIFYHSLVACYVAVDIGSNSVRMEAAEVATGGFRIAASERRVTRLGESVFRNGRISSAAMDDTIQTLASMARIYRELNPDAVRAVGTSALRDAGNQQEFLTRANEALGTTVEVISGPEEARLIYLG